ncbi:uncharacterized protein IAS62_001555 [Cryptococcus decagattii]|uniref:serine C-palmitoyltransferase n=1 Tax=Cryptococcus decagattii TaxID=1859122 RepID=A0ABZ2APF7_9TREE
MGGCLHFATRHLFFLLSRQTRQLSQIMGRTTRRSTKSQSGTSTPPNISSPPSRPLFPSISLRSSSPTPPSHENLSARSSLLNVLTRPGHTVAATPDSPEEELSDLSTVSSYASSVISGTHSKDMTEEEIAKVYENYLEKPFVQTKTTIKHSEFGHCNNPNWRWTSQWNPNEGYAALNSDFDSFYTRRLKKRLDDCFARPTTGVPGRTIVCYDRSSTDQNNTFQLTGTTTRALNVSSYNYLGFASSTGGCADAVEMAIKRYGVASAGARHEASTTDLHLQCEKLVAKFLGVEAAMVVSMGYATNSTTIPALVGKGCLVISDEFNHASIRAGVRMSGASMRWYKHNDMDVLENLLREVISQGQPRTHRPWKKILVIVEGLFSMEGSLVDLPRLIELKKRYKFYLYVDEAHSIGAMGPNGRGVCDYFGIDPREVDVLMGTVTKSFGAAGGYIAGTKQLIDRLRIRSHATAYAESVSPAILTQIIASMGSIMGIAPPLAAPPTEDDKSDTWSIASRPAVYGPAPSSLLPSWLTLPPHLLNGTEGRERLRRIAFNSRYLASGLRKLGFIVYGNRDSPIIPLLIFQPGKMGYFSRMMLERIGPDKTPIVVVVVAYPATPLITSRVRFCLSASHTKNDMDMVLRACDEVGDVLNLKYNKQEMSVEEVIANAEELVAASHV